MELKPFENKVWLSSPTMHGEELKYMTEAYETNWMSKMTVTKEKFIFEFAKAIKSNQAAIFAGAGISQPLGIPSWKNILEPLANEMNLEITNGTDLTQIAQYYVNENNGRRTELEEHFIHQINKTIQIKENSLVNILVKLDISSYWTTNYDMVFERYFEYNHIKYNKIATASALYC